MIPISSGSTNWKEACTSKAKSTRRWKSQLIYCVPYSMDHERAWTEHEKGYDGHHLDPCLTRRNPHCKIQGCKRSAKMEPSLPPIESGPTFEKGLLSLWKYFVEFDFKFIPGIWATFKHLSSCILLNQLSGNISPFMSDLLPARFNPFCSAANIPSVKK